MISIKTKLILGGILIAVIGLMMWRIDDLRGQRDDYKESSRAYQAALKIEMDSNIKKMAALELDTARYKQRALQLNQTIQDIRENDEIVECPMPYFFRDAFERM